MVTVVTDWHDGPQPTVRQDSGGLYATRPFLILGLDGTASTRLVRALSVTGIPVTGDGHPATGTLKVRAVRPEIYNRDPQSVQVVVEYFRAGDSSFDPDNPSTSDPVFIENRTQLEDVRVVEDSSGSSISGRIVEKPAQVFVVEKSTTDTLEDLIRDYAGKANSVACRLQSSASTKWAVHTVRCDGFEPVGQVVDGRSVNRFQCIISLAPNWEDSAWGWRFPEGTTSYTFDKVYEEANLINSGFLVS